MGSADRPISILIKIQSTSSNVDDPEDVEKDTRRLHDELMELDIVEKVDLVAKGEAPEGSKTGGEMVALGSLMATLATTAGSALIPSLANSLQSWLTRHENKKITLEIGGNKLEVTGISEKDQRRLIDIWIQNQAGKANEVSKT